MKYLLSLLALLASANLGLAQNTRQLPLEEFLSPATFPMKSVSGIRSTEDGEYYTTMHKESDKLTIVKYSYKTGKAVDTIFNVVWLSDNAREVLKTASDYTLSPDEQSIMFTCDEEKIYRHSSAAFHYLWKRAEKGLNSVSGNGKQMYATFSPDNKRIAFVRDNNIYIKDLQNGKEEAITTDGRRNFIINGTPDWVYEEEFSFSVAFYWSPDSKYIAYYKFDESQVKEYDLIYYKDKLYPELYRYRYPKAGEDNSIVSLHVYNLGSRVTTKIESTEGKDTYIPRVKWTNTGNVLCFSTLNRAQNKLDLKLANVSSGVVNTVLTETSNTYVDIIIDNENYHDIFEDLIFLKDGKRFIWPSERDGYFHLYMYDISGKMLKQLTAGAYDVCGVMAVDELKGIVYYTSAELSPQGRDIYSIGLNGSNKKRLSNGGTNAPLFSNGAKYYINVYSTANTPPVYTLMDTRGRMLRVIEENKELTDAIKTNGLVKKAVFRCPGADGTELIGLVLKPANFDPAKKYPVLMTVYGGPGNNEANDRWEQSKYLWHQYIASKGYVVLTVDNRGTGSRGAAFKKCTYKELGKIETEDQIAVAKYLGTQSWVDNSRIGISGHSYGGYMSLLCMTKGAEYFKMGIAGAPVTNWRLYDNIYTERYMLKPQDNGSGYDQNSPVSYADKLKGKLLILHGSGDDNVHMQNTMSMVSALQKANKKFDLMIYPDATHGIRGKHYWRLITEYVLNNL